MFKIRRAKPQPKPFDTNAKILNEKPWLWRIKDTWIHRDKIRITRVDQIDFLDYYATNLANETGNVCYVHMGTDFGEKVVTVSLDLNRHPRTMYDVLAAIRDQGQRLDYVYHIATMLTDATGDDVRVYLPNDGVTFEQMFDNHYRTRQHCE